MHTKNWYKDPNNKYPFDLFFDPAEPDTPINKYKAHFLVRWKITEEWRVPQILVRFTHYKSVIEVVTVHYTARTAEGHYQPWSAWDGCTLTGDPPDHGRKIWRMVRSNNYYPISAGTIGPGMTTRYKDQMWKPNHAELLGKKYDYISEYALNA